MTLHWCRLLGTVVGALALLLVLVVGVLVRPAAGKAAAATTAKRELVHHLMLTDLAVWSEARYTRHPSQADLFAAFQDHPASLEHFPAGSVVVASRPQLPRAVAGPVGQ